MVSSTGGVFASLKTGLFVVVTISMKNCKQKDTRHLFGCKTLLEDSIWARFAAHHFDANISNSNFEGRSSFLYRLVNGHIPPGSQTSRLRNPKNDALEPQGLLLKMTTFFYKKLGWELRHGHILDIYKYISTLSECFLCWFLMLSTSKSSWWFQPSWKILVKMGIFPKWGWK